jgi:phosphatidylserine/phosphatidylglycerophosphate/cardiolipin synthase-like enzyme
MPKQETSTKASRNGLTITAYPGDGSVLLAFNLEEKPKDDLAGFAIKRIPPRGQPLFLVNRLNFTTPVVTTTHPEQRKYTPSNLAPFQKFRWVDFPKDIESGDYRYEITTFHFKKGGGLKKGVSGEISFEMTPEKFEDFEMGFTRGYLSSQAYVEKFDKAPIRPKGKKTIDFDTSKFMKQYEWLGFHARKMIFNFLQEALQDQTITLDVFTYDLDEPDIVRNLEKLGKRLRIFLDNASLHTGPNAIEPKAKKILTQSAGADRVKVGHFMRFAHNKVMIQKKNGKPVKVLTGSANFSIRGLYVQANNILLFDDPNVASLYEKAFDQTFNDPSATQSGFAKSEIASQYFEIDCSGCPDSAVAFSPHKDPLTSLGLIADAIEKADSSVMFAIMELGGGGPVFDQIKRLDTREIFTYGVTQSLESLSVFKPGSKRGKVVPFAYLKDKVPKPFREEWSGGPGQVVHHKFVVVDFNDSDPVVFTGSSNLSAGGEKNNGDNLIATFDRGIATAYAVEAVRLLDHYEFRSKMMQATEVKPMKLKGPDDRPRWWAPCFDPNHIKYRDRLLFSK